MRTCDFLRMMLDAVGSSVSGGWCSEAVRLID